MEQSPQHASPPSWRGGGERATFCPNVSGIYADPSCVILAVHVHVRSRRNTLGGVYFRIKSPGEIAVGDTLLLVDRPHPEWPLHRVGSLLYGNATILPQGGLRETKGEACVCLHTPATCCKVLRELCCPWCIRAGGVVHNRS